LTPTGQNKKPILKSVLQQASKDLGKIRAWEERYPGCRWAIRLDPDTDVMVLDIEGPEKGKGDGLATLAQLECKHSAKLPEGPNARSMNGGTHLWGRCPGKYAHVVKNWTSPLGMGCGLDLRVHTGSVAVPPSTGYHWIIPPTAMPLPVWPEWLVRELLKAKGIDPDNPTSAKVLAPRSSPPNRSGLMTLASEPYSDKLYFRLGRKCPTFQATWNRVANFSDASNSSYEFAIAKAALTWGFTPGQDAIAGQKVVARHAELRPRESPIQRGTVPSRDSP
jgi:hypothetical protein